MTTSRLCSDSRAPRRARPRPRTLASPVAFLALALAGASPGAADTVARDAALCAALGSSARDAVALGYAAEAVELLDEAISYVPSDPDANYLRALLGLSSGDTLASVAPRLEAALAGGAFRLYRPEDARLLYASVLVRTRRASEALRFVSGQPVSAESLYVETAARLAIGDEAGAAAAVTASLRSYPADPRPLLAWLRARDRPISSARDAAVVEAGFAALYRMKELEPEALVALAPYAGSAEEARLLVREFRAVGGKSPEASVLALSLGLVSEDRAVKEMFAGEYAIAHRQLLALRSLLSSDEARAAFSRAFSAFSGAIERDDDRDGFPEAVSLYDSGQIARWALDEDQDGVPEIEASFASGEPLAVSLRSGSTRVALSYDRWPYAEEISFADGQGERIYSLGPGSLALPLIGVAPVAEGEGPPYLASRTGLAPPSERAVMNLAYQVRRYGETRETVQLLDGEPSRSWWTDAYRRIGYAVYRRGLPSAEDVDADGDGRYEARRYWRRGPEGDPEPAYIEVDLDGDGLYEYREGLSGPRLSSWDYDADGSVDMTLSEREGALLVYRYLGARGRVTEVAYRDGRIDSVTEDGAPAPLTRDSGGAVVWIGEKPFDFGPRLPPAGRGSRNGVMYVVIEIGGTTYAQRIE